MRVCIIGAPQGTGGPITFRRHLAHGLAMRGVEVVHNLDEHPYDVVMLAPGTRHLGGLYRCVRQDIPIVQRLDDINWLHRVYPMTVQARVSAEFRNFLLAFARKRLVTRVVYQSKFAEDWWNRSYGVFTGESSVIYNATELGIFCPDPSRCDQHAAAALLTVESNYQNGDEIGLFALAQAAQLWRSQTGRQVIVEVVGNAPPPVRNQADQLYDHIKWHGRLRSCEVLRLMQGASLFYASDINASCSNAVIEALACGLPVVGYDTGALPELLAQGGGITVPYGADPWKAEFPDVSALAQALQGVVAQRAMYARQARAAAEKRFGVDQMVSAYKAVLEM